jgi:hypothetical protein
MITDEDDTIPIQVSADELRKLRRDSSIKTRVAAERARDSAHDAVEIADSIVESVRTSWRPPEQ